MSLTTKIVQFQTRKPANVTDLCLRFYGQVRIWTDGNRWPNNSDRLAFRKRRLRKQFQFKSCNSFNSLLCYVYRRVLRRTIH